MARGKPLRSTSRPRYRFKLARMLGIEDQEAKKQTVIEASNEWDKNYGEYHNAYKEMIAAFGNRIPPAQKGLYRSALFKMIKAAKKGSDIEAVIDELVSKGYDRGLLEDIAVYFGLLEKSEEKQATQET